MSQNKSMKVTYRAFDQPHEEIFPITMTIGELHNYLRNVCSTYIIVDMNPTTREHINLKPEE